MESAAAETFPFRPWVRAVCRRAMIWGVGVVAALGLLAWALYRPGSAPLGRAFGALVFYGLLFWLTLLKIWWTAGRPAVVLEEEALAYQPLHAFRPRRIPFDRILATAPRPGTSSLRIVHAVGAAGVAREFFLNLGVVEGRNRLLEGFGRRLREHGLEPVAESWSAWRRPGFPADA